MRSITPRIATATLHERAPQPVRGCKVAPKDRGKQAAKVTAITHRLRDQCLEGGQLEYGIRVEQASPTLPMHISGISLAE